jgi:hypothetical protein
VKYISPLISDGRNKLGGDVFARNRAGVYVRTWLKPKNPKTVLQQTYRANFSTYTKGFRGLTAAQIAAWNLLASNTTLVDTLGQNYTPTGLQLFISCNQNLYFIGASPIVNAPQKKPSFPTILRPGSYIEIPAGEYVSLVLCCSAAALALYGSLLASMTPPLSNGVSFVGSSVYRCIGPSEYPSPPYAVWGVSALWPKKVAVPGQNIGIKVRLIDPATGYGSTPETVIITPGF